jgi:hypothetical protein
LIPNLISHDLCSHGVHDHMADLIMFYQLKPPYDTGRINTIDTRFHVTYTPFMKHVFPERFGASKLSMEAQVSLINSHLTPYGAHVTQYFDPDLIIHFPTHADLTNFILTWS